MSLIMSQFAGLTSHSQGVTIITNLRISMTNTNLWADFTVWVTYTLDETLPTQIPPTKWHRAKEDVERKRNTDGTPPLLPSPVNSLYLACAEKAAETGYIGKAYEQPPKKRVIYSTKYG